MNVQRVYQIVRKQSYDFLRTNLTEPVADSKLEVVDVLFRSQLHDASQHKFCGNKIEKIFFIENPRFSFDPWLKPILERHQKIKQQKIPGPNKSTRAQQCLLLLQLLFDILPLLYIVFKLYPNYKLLVVCLRTLYKYHKEYLYFSKINFDRSCVLLTNSYNHPGLITAVKGSNGQVVEVQHSVIYASHKGYDYHRWVDLFLAPTGIYLYSRLWQAQIKSAKLTCFEYNSSQISKESRNFSFSCDQTRDARIIIFSQKTKTELIRKLVGKLDPITKKRVFIKPHPKENTRDLVDIAPILTTPEIYGSDLLFAFNSSVIIDLYDQGAFCNVYDENAVEFNFLNNIRVSAHLDDLFAANTKWSRNSDLPIFSRTTDHLTGG